MVKKGTLYSKDMILWFDELCTPQIKIDKEIKFLDNVFRKYKVKKVLDIGCATGRHAIELAKKGYIVTGVDASKAAINIAKERAKNLDVEFYQQDMRNLRIKGKYDAVMSMGTFQYLTTNDDCIKVLDSCNKLLKKNGILLISAQPLWADLISGNLGSEYKAVYRKGNKKLIMSGKREFTPRHNWAIAFSKYYRFLGSKALPVIKEKISVWRIFFPEEFDLLFRLTGFKTLDFYGDAKINAKLSAKNSKRLIVIAQKIF